MTGERARLPSPSAVIEEDRDEGGEGRGCCRACFGEIVENDPCRVPRFLQIRPIKVAKRAFEGSSLDAALDDPARLSPSWRIGGYGGAPMPEATIAALAKKLPGLVLMNAYGSTETCSPSTIMPSGETSAHPNSVGKAVPCAVIKIVDRDTKEVPRGEAGEIWIKGPMVVPGYWNDPEKTAVGFPDGYWRSGDVGSMDDEGFIHLHDRIKDVINRGGYNVYSAELENMLSFHPDIIECAAVAQPDEILGEKIHVFARTRSHDTTAEQLRQFCSDRLADYKVPDFVTCLDRPLPRNANGKVMKEALRAEIADKN